MINLRLSFNFKGLASQVAILRNGLLSEKRSESTKVKEMDEIAFTDFEDPEEPEEVAAREALIEKKRNKSKLFPSDYNRQHGRMPYDEPQFFFHESLRYRRRLYGKFGAASGVNPSILWPSKKELDAMKEFREVLEPYEFHKLVERMREKNELAEKERIEKETQILENVKNIKMEIMEFHKRVAAKKKEAELLAEKKNRLIEEARRRFGYKVDLRDEKFQAMLAEIQKEEKKKVKAAKKAVQEQKLMAFQEAEIEAQKKRAREAEESEQSEDK